MSRETAFKKMVSTVKDKNSVQIRDTFQTPKYAIDLLVPFIPKNIKFVWEPACGDGRIVSALYEEGSRPWVCYQSDIRQSDVFSNNICNFLTDEPPLLFDTERWAIITNPPFSIKEAFIEKAFEYKVPFAFLINADYSGQMVDWIRRGCEKIVPTSRINYITPNVVQRINEGEGLIDGMRFASINEIPSDLLYKYSSAQFHSLWLTYGFGLGRTETFVDLPVKLRKERM